MIPHGLFTQPRPIHLLSIVKIKIKPIHRNLLCSLHPGKRVFKKCSPVEPEPGKTKTGTGNTGGVTTIPFPILQIIKASADGMLTTEGDQPWKLIHILQKGEAPFVLV
jgi:hypothetical protein